MDENEWQPVRVVLKEPHPERFDKRELQRAAKNAGEIIHVVPKQPRKKLYCDGPHYLVHPDDVAKVYGEPVPGEFFVCEHQILAD